MGQRQIAEAGMMSLPQQLSEVLERLNNEDRRTFVEEITGALVRAQAENDLAEVEYVAKAWWVSMLFVSHPHIEEAFAVARADDSPVMTSTELGDLLGVA